MTQCDGFFLMLLLLLMFMFLSHLEFIHPTSNCSLLCIIIHGPEDEMGNNTLSAPVEHPIHIKLIKSKVIVVVESWNPQRLLYWYSMDWMFVLPQIPVLRPWPPQDGIGMWGLGDVTGLRWGHEHRVLKMGCDLIRRDTRELICPFSLSPSLSLFSLSLPCENTTRRWSSGGRKQLLTRTQPCWHAYLRLPGF